jgi:hypothetical protein
MPVRALRSSLARRSASGTIWSARRARAASCSSTRGAPRPVVAGGTRSIASFPRSPLSVMGSSVVRRATPAALQSTSAALNFKRDAAAGSERHDVLRRQRVGFGKLFTASSPIFRPISEPTSVELR